MRHVCPNVPECTRMYPNVPECTSIFAPNVPDHGRSWMSLGLGKERDIAALEPAKLDRHTERTENNNWQ